MDKIHGHHIVTRSARTSGTLVLQPMQLEQQYADAIGTAWWSGIVHGYLMMRCMCRAAFAGDTEKLLKLLEDMAPEKRTALDTHGNTVSLHAILHSHAAFLLSFRACQACHATQSCEGSQRRSATRTEHPCRPQVLHIAVLRQNVGLVKALVGAGFSVMKQNTRSWLALDEAVSLKSRELVSARLLRRRASFLLAHPSRPCSFCTSHCNRGVGLAIHSESRLEHGAAALRMMRKVMAPFVPPGCQSTRVMQSEERHFATPC